MVDPDPAVDAYVDQAPEGRREGLRLLRALCRAPMHEFTETMRDRMPGYVRGDEVEIGFAAQKRYLSFYVTRTDVIAADRGRLAGPGLGKGCVRSC
jgi:uncharacterized protein YdhG (YjbR/CyaY superfamily)